MNKFWVVISRLFVVLTGGLSLSCMAREACEIPAGLLLQPGLDPEFVGKFCFFTAVLLLWTIFIGKLLKIIFKLPVIAGQIIAGILIGPSFLDIAGREIFSSPLHLIDFNSGQMFTVYSSDLFVFFIVLLSSAFTVSYLLWVAGHETDIKDILKIGVTAFNAGLLGAVLPIVTTVAFIYYVLGLDWNMVQSVGVGLVFAATSVSIPVAMLFSKNKMHLKSSKATLGAAIIDDIIAVILLSMFFLCLQSGVFGVVQGVTIPAHAGGAITVAIIAMIISFAVILLFGYFVIPFIIRMLKKFHFSHLIPAVAHGIMLFYFAFAQLFGGLAGITGTYFAGLFHHMGDKKHKAEKTMSPFVNAVLLPLFLGSIGLQFDLAILNLHEWFIVLTLLILAIISKLVACYIAIGLSNISRRKGNYRWSMIEGYLFGSAMVARGEVGLVIAGILFGASVFSANQYIIAVMVIILSTIAAPILLSIGFTQLDKIEAEQIGKSEFKLNIGVFSIIGTAQMFNVIVGLIEDSGQYRTSVQMSEGRKIVNIEGQNVEIILCPDVGIVLRGNQQKINEILQLARNAVNGDVERLSMF